MRYLFGLVVFFWAASAFGQEIKPADGGQSANFISENWSKLGPATEGARGFTLYGRGIRLNSSGQYELWIKVIPSNAGAFNKRYDLPKNAAAVLQYTTVDCAKRQLLFERTALFDAANTAVEGRVSGLMPVVKKDTVRPGSIGESVYRNVCVDPSTLPKPVQLKPQTN